MSEATTASPAKAKRPLWQKVAGGFVVFIVAMVILANVAASGAVKVSNAFLGDIQNQRADAAYSLLSKEAATATPKDQFTVIVGRIGSLLNSKTNMTSKEVKGETGSSATSTVTYEIKGTDGITYQVTVNLTKEGGQWKVLNFDSTAKK